MINKIRNVIYMIALWAALWLPGAQAAPQLQGIPTRVACAGPLIKRTCDMKHESMDDVPEMVSRGFGKSTRFPTATTFPNGFTAVTSKENSGGGLNQTAVGDIGAVGPTQFIAVARYVVRSFNKTTGQPDGVLNLAIDNFFGAGEMGHPSDPKIEYDAGTGRWFVAAVSEKDMNTQICFAVSNTTDGIITPATTWSFYYFTPSSLTPPSTGNNFRYVPFYLVMGIDKNALYISDAPLVQAPTEWTELYVIQKASISMTSSTAPVINVFRDLYNPTPAATGTGARVVNPVTNFDTAPGTSDFGYAIAGFADGTGAPAALNLIYNKLAFFVITSPGGLTPTISSPILFSLAGIVSPTGTVFGGTAVNFNQPSPATTPINASGQFDKGSNTFMSVHIRDNQLYAAHALNVDISGNAVAANNRFGIRFYQFDISGLASSLTAPPLIQYGLLWDSTTILTADAVNYMYPSMMSNTDVVLTGTVTTHDLAIGFGRISRSATILNGAGGWVNCGFVGREKSDALGTLQTSVMYTAGTSIITNPAGATATLQWGPWSFTSLDPSDNLTFWTIQQWIYTTNAWALQVAKLS